MPGREPVGPRSSPRHGAAPSRWRPLQAADRRGEVAVAVRGRSLSPPLPGSCAAVSPRDMLPWIRCAVLAGECLGEVAQAFPTLQSWAPTKCRRALALPWLWEDHPGGHCCIDRSPRLAASTSPLKLGRP
jgi:hypothetical protein